MRLLGGCRIVFPEVKLAHGVGLALSGKTPYPTLVSSTVSSVMAERARKITVEIPTELLEKAQRASGSGVTQTVRTGLQLLAASQTYGKLRGLRGRVRFTRTAADLKDDR